ncbi:solute carrier family 25 member 16, transcript variant X3 [Ictidomys tridecemlineatus]|uniref:graves disease carrier protein isoform X3 n=1 Tax=Ictidomys tridecemlineatus TaxID=43179 RepID=UPI000B53FA9B|nr:graves disease carrier protein isoform X3 [Ictidomys tridecemlineatus]KAG3264804.1 solute carrier family 25 member 16, transcript variant X3 [Ictidomys tridecemlineatus]
MAAAAALAAAETPPAMPQAAGAGGPTARRDFYWLRSFLAGGIAGCCAKTTVAPLDRVKVLLQAHNHHYKHLGVFSALRAVPQKEGYLGLYKGNGAMMIRIFPYGAIQFMAFEQYKTLITTKLGVSGHVHRLMAGSMAGRWFPWILQRTDAHYIRNGSICRYPFDVTRRRMQLGTVLPEFEKCLTMRETMKYVYGHHGIRKGLYRGLSLNYIRCIPSQAVAFTTYELMKQFFHLN